MDSNIQTILADAFVEQHINLKNAQEWNSSSDPNGFIFDLYGLRELETTADMDAKIVEFVSLRFRDLLDAYVSWKKRDTVWMISTDVGFYLDINTEDFIFTNDISIATEFAIEQQAIDIAAKIGNGEMRSRDGSAPMIVGVQEWVRKVKTEYKRKD